MAKTPTIFEILDKNTFHIGAFYPLNIFKNINIWRTYFGWIVIAGLCFWCVLGFDSVIEQLYPLINNFISYLTGKMTIESISSMMNENYGKGSHFSAVVIYGLSWIYLSNILEKNGIVKSYNFFMTMLLTFLNMGIFEVAWNRCCAYFQNLPWLLLQKTNVPQYYAWIIIGCLAFLYLYVDGYRPNISTKTVVLFSLTLCCWVFWIYYPFSTQQISVETTEGLWTSSKLFPQTLYTVDITPKDETMRGIFYYVENNMVHFTNVLAKILTTAFIVLFCGFRRVEK